MYYRQSGVGISGTPILLCLPKMIHFIPDSTAWRQSRCNCWIVRTHACVFNACVWFCCTRCWLCAWWKCYWTPVWNYRGRFKSILWLPRFKNYLVDSVERTTKSLLNTLQLLLKYVKTFGIQRGKNYKLPFGCCEARKWTNSNIEQPSITTYILNWS